MKPNILFIVIDSLRADKIFGATKRSKTPNINNLLLNGLFFDQAISSVDATDPSLGCLFTGKYPFNSGISLYQNHSKASFFFDLLKSFNYNRYAMIPDKSFFKTITNDFDLAETYSVDPYTLLYQGTGQRIVERLDSKMFREPWIYFIHLMDLHPSGNKFIFPDKFSTHEYGQNQYEKAISALDVWVGKIVEKIDFNNTLIILTSDHGDYIPITDNRITEIDDIQSTFKKIKKAFPYLEPVGLKIFILLQFIIGKYRKKKFTKVFTEEQMRSFNSRAGWHLYDEIIRVPLIMCGKGIPPGLLISKQVRHIDLLPTLLDLLTIDKKFNFDGKSLLSLINGGIYVEEPAYIESASTNPTQLGNVIGLRTPNYKYFRSRNKNNEKVHLYNLYLDPNEKNNIANLEPNIVNNMEKLLYIIQKTSIKSELNELIKKKRHDLSLQE